METFQTFHIMTLSGKGMLKGSIFGVVVATSKPGQLPQIPDGYWENYRIIREADFKLADEAKKSIEERGYYLFGGYNKIAD